MYRCTGVWVYRCTKYMDLQVYKMYGCTFVNGLLVASWSTVQRFQLIHPALKSPPKMRVVLGLFPKFSEI